MTTNTVHPMTTQKLRAFARRRRLLLAARALCAAGVTFVGGITIIALLDRFIVMPDWLRFILSGAAYAAVLLVIVWAGVLPLLRGRRHSEIARLLGGALPELGDDIVSAVELGDPKSDARWDSESFREALQSSVGGRIGEARMSLALPWRLIAGWLGAAAALAAVVAALWAIPSMRFGQLLTRAAAPTVNLARVSDITIKLVQPERPDQPEPRGDPLPILAEVRGRGVQEATLRIRHGDGNDTEAKMEPGQQAGQFTASLDVGAEPLAFRIEAGDAATRWYKIDARPRPEAVKFDKTYEFPEYARWPAKHVVEESGDLAALEGSHAAIVVETDQPVKEARLRITAGDKPQSVAMTPVSPSAGGVSAHWSASIPLAVAGTYQVDFTAAETGFENKFSPQYEIRPIPDLRPSAEITRPATDEHAAADGAIELRGSAHDDVALAGVVQMIRVNQGPWREVPLMKEGAAEAVIQRSWSLKELKLHDGDQVTTKLVATDRKGNTGESEPVQITIGLLTAASQPAPGQKITEAIKSLAAAADQLHAQTSDAARTSDKDVKATSAEASKIAEKQEALDRGVADLRDELKRDANQQDLLTPEGRELARDDDDAAAMLRPPTPAADDLLHQAEKAGDAPSQQKSLRSAADEQNKLAATLKQLAAHFDAAQAGQPEATRAQLRQAEAPLGIKAALDSQYGQLQKLAEMSQMSPEQLKPALEGELPKDPTMQGELSQIAKNSLDEAKSDLAQAAADEKRTAQDLTRSDPAPDTAAAAAKQAQVADALQHASDNVDRAAQDAQRLGQPDAAKALQSSADQTRNVAKNDVPAAQQALQEKSPSDAQAAVQKAAAAIDEQAQKLDAAAKAASAAAPMPNDSSHTSSTPPAPNDPQHSPSPAPSTPSDQHSPSPVPSTAAAQPAEAASKWMAAALDHLDQAAQSAATKASQPSPSSLQNPGDAAAAASKSPPEQPAGDSSSAQSSAPMPGQSAQASASGSPPQAQSGEPQANQGAAAPSGEPEKQSDNAAPGSTSQSSTTAAMAAIRAAANAQAEAMRDSRMSRGSSSGPSDASGGASAAGGPTVDGSSQSGDVTGPIPNGHGGNWGKLSPQAARDLMESHRENIPAEYRQQVEAYFRAIAEKTSGPKQP